MKKSITLLTTFILIVNVANSTVRTVNNFGGGAQYSDLGSAFTASANGDTIILSGSPNAYGIGSCSGWTKNLVVYSSGFNAQKQNAYRANIAGDNCNNVGYSLRIAPAGSGTRFYGIEFPNGIAILPSVAGTLQNYTFEHCKFNSTFSMQENFPTANTMNNFVIRNCIFDGDNSVNLLLSNYVSLTTNLLISNCIFDGYVAGHNTNGSHTMTVDHCVFLSNSNTNPLFKDVYNHLIKNCIFMNNTNLTNGSGIVFQNNMARLFTMSAPNITAATDPGFTTYTLGSLYSPTHNYNVTNATALTGSTDGTQIGANGGTSKFNESGEVLIAPIVRTVIVNNTTIAPGGTINVQINATKPNDN